MIKEILGIWTLDPNDIHSIRIYGNTSVEFTDKGELIYTVHLSEKEQKMYMTYEILGNVLITNQISSPQKEKTEFKILPNDTLELFFGGVKSTYSKVHLTAK